MAQYTPGQIVDFYRNTDLNAIAIPVIAVVPIVPTGNLLTPVEQTYIIENVNGWLPNKQRIAQFSLNPIKKYLFVLQSELSPNP